MFSSLEDCERYLEQFFTIKYYLEGWNDEAVWNMVQNKIFIQTISVANEKLVFYFNLIKKTLLNKMDLSDIAILY